jgi:hypothetical protein
MLFTYNTYYDLHCKITTFIFVKKQKNYKKPPRPPHIESNHSDYQKILDIFPNLIYNRRKSNAYTNRNIQLPHQIKRSLTTEKNDRSAFRKRSNKINL